MDSVNYNELDNNEKIDYIHVVLTNGIKNFSVDQTIDFVDVVVIKKDYETFGGCVSIGLSEKFMSNIPYFSENCDETIIENFSIVPSIDNKIKYYKFVGVNSTIPKLLPNQHDIFEFENPINLFLVYKNMYLYMTKMAKIIDKINTKISQCVNDLEELKTIIQ